MQNLYIKISGKTPLLMNNPKETLEVKEEGAKKGKVEHPSLEKQAEIRRYLTDDGYLYVPAQAVRKALLRAAIGYTAKGETGRRRAVGPVLAGSLLIAEPRFILLDEKSKQMTGDRYTVHTERVVVGTGARAASIWRGRPEIFPWLLKCVFLYDSRRMDADLVKEIAVDAGTYPGLLDYRPEKGGWYGTFDVIDFSVK